jgi:hypothetical protein
MTIQVAAEWKTKIPDNINPLSPTGFRFGIQKLPKLQFYCQTVNLPGIVLGEPSFGTPFSAIPLPGDTLTFSDLQVQFLIDKNMENFKAIQGWMYGLGFPQNYQQYVNFQKIDQSFPTAAFPTGVTQDTVSGITDRNDLSKNYSDASLFILTNNNSENILLNFRNVFPTSLDTLTFTGVDTDVTYLIGNATFKYTYYEFA